MGAVLLAALARASRPGEIRDGYRVWVELPREKDEERWSVPSKTNGWI